jgi:hypothetical protein
MGTLEWLHICRFALEVLVFTVALTSVSIAAASVRRTVGAGIVTATLAFIALAFMTMLPFRVISPRFVMMRYFMYALGELPNPFPTAGDSSFVRVYSVLDFLRTTTVTALLASVPALFYFSRRDVTE